MKCEVCLEWLEEYFDGELAPDAHAEARAHVIACPRCAESFALLSAEQELFARYDRKLEISPTLWSNIADEITPRKANHWRDRVAGLFAPRSASFASAVAMLLLAIGLGLVYFWSRPPAKEETVAAAPSQLPSQPLETPRQSESTVSEPVRVAARPKLRPPRRASIDHSGVFYSSLDYLDLDDLDTARHIQQTETLLRSIWNVPISESDEEIDVSYDKALSRRLLNENVVLRREAEMKAKFPVKTLLADLEPLLLDIANLPERARPEEVLAIKEQVRKTEIVAALLSYQGGGPNNR